MTMGVCQKTNAVYFLLGREKYWKKFKDDSEKWSDFGGRSKAGETAERTAAREFWEETCGCVAFAGGDAVPLADCDAVELYLRRKEYVYKFDFEVRGSDGGIYTTFVCQIPLQPGCAGLFSLVRASRTDDVFLEKTKLAWFGLQQLRNAAFSTPVLRCDSFMRREFVRRWFRDRIRLILPYLAV